MPIQRLPSALHVTLGAPWVGGVSFLQHHHDVEDMPVHKVHPHCCPCRYFPRAPLHGACPRSPLCQKVHPLLLGYPDLGRGGPLTLSPRCFPMSSHQMTRQGSDCQMLSALLAGNPRTLPFSVRVPFPRNSPPIRRLSDISCRLAGVAHHAECLLNVRLQAHPVEQAYMGVKCALELDGVQ